MNNRTMRFALAALVFLAGAGAATAGHAQSFDFQSDCAGWIAKKGYSSDYIKLKVGKRQRGNPDSWRGNVEPKEVQPGDVVMSYIREKGRNMRVAYVEEVVRNSDGTAGAVILSEWNEGKYVDERCFATDHFGRLSPPRRIPLDGIVRVWRPSLPLPAAAVE